MVKTDNSKLSVAEVKALNDALDDEYHSWATYDQVISDFGNQRPFINIRDAEARHIEALVSLFNRYSLPVPANGWPGKVDRYQNLQQACEAAVNAEVANAELFDQLIDAVVARADISRVFRNLQEASLERHLPAFQRCAQRGVENDSTDTFGGRGGRGGKGSGSGRGRAGRHGAFSDT